MERAEFTDRKSSFEQAAFAVRMPARVSSRVNPPRAESEGPRPFEGEGQGRQSPSPLSEFLHLWLWPPASQTHKESREKSRILGVLSSPGGISPGLAYSGKKPSGADGLLSPGAQALTAIPLEPPQLLALDGPRPLETDTYDK